MTADPYPDLSGDEELRAARLDTGGDDGAGGERVALSEADSRLLDALSRPDPPVVTAVEDQPRTVRAGRGDSRVPPPTPPGRGPLAPVFQEPAD